MCGIFAVLREPATRTPPTAQWADQMLKSAVDSATATTQLVKGLTGANEYLAELNTALKGTPGICCLLENPSLSGRIEAVVGQVEAKIRAVEADLDAGNLADLLSLEMVNQVLVELKDVTWALTRDRLRTAQAVDQMARGSRLEGELTASCIEAYTSIQLALSAIDRLEVRGRDSAGVSVLVTGHGMSIDELDQLVGARSDPHFGSNAVQRAGETVIFVYKAAAEIGALGDNIAHIRSAIMTDDVLRRMVSMPPAEAVIVAHTRWASVGTVSEPNAHPVDSQEIGRSNDAYVIATLNGDVDNYAQLKEAEHLAIADDITTDAKVIPMLVSRRMADGERPLEAFVETVNRFEGSVAITAATAVDPSKILLAVHGSGQGCYVGFAENAFLVASEPYGLVEECSTYVRLDGEVVSEQSGKHGQVVELSRQGAGTLTALRRISYGGEELPVVQADVISTEVTTRDIDRGGAPHFLLKEIKESPQSVRRTLRGKIVEENGRLRVALPKEAFPDELRDALASGAFKHIIAIGQGTAAIASRSIITVLEDFAPSNISLSARPASELSGFGLRDDMSDTLIVAVSQSGTTTDTNRTVDLVRSRGAKVIAMVNRRQSDLTEKADGVLYTSDGRDVEMSVASTKAFYSQVTAGSLLAIAIAGALGVANRQDTQALLVALRKLPSAMQKVINDRSIIAPIAQRFAPSRRSWALVGNGPNFIAANELRIKLSELCYKSIAIDATEDKKHIDLSAEPMILVCAAGLQGSTAVDVAKEIAIYGAHKACAIVITSDPEQFTAAAATIEVPSLHPVIDFVLSTVAGHIFGYEAALAIDGQARLMRVARAVLDEAVAHEAETEEALFERVRIGIMQPAAAIFAELRSGALNGHVSPNTAVEVAMLLRYATGVLPLDALEIERGEPISPRRMLSDLLVALTTIIDELTRPIDAVKHQAKTVTVGISRTEDSFASSMLVGQVLAAGGERDRLSYRSARTLAALDQAVEQVIGYTLYAVEGDPVVEGAASLTVIDKGGIAADIVSRAESDPRLTGTKRRAAYERMVTVGRGQRDSRSVIIVPQSKDQQVTGIVLLHVKFRPVLPVEEAKSMLVGYRNRYAAIVDAVTETQPRFDDSVLASVPTLDLLFEPVWVLARHWLNT